MKYVPILKCSEINTLFIKLLELNQLTFKNINKCFCPFECTLMYKYTCVNAHKYFQGLHVGKMLLSMLTERLLVCE